MDTPVSPENESVEVVFTPGELPPAPIRRKVDSSPVTRVTVSMTEQAKEDMKTLALGNDMKISQLVRLSLENQDFLESVVRDGGHITVEIEGTLYDFNPIE